MSQQEGESSRSVEADPSIVFLRAQRDLPPGGKASGGKASGPDGGAPDEGPPALVMLLVVLALVVGGYFLAQKLRNQGRLEDCMMQGRTNCAPLDSSSGR